MSFSTNAQYSSKRIALFGCLIVLIVGLIGGIFVSLDRDIMRGIPSDVPVVTPATTSSTYRSAFEELLDHPSLSQRVVDDWLFSVRVPRTLQSFHLELVQAWREFTSSDPTDTDIRSFLEQKYDTVFSP